MVRKNNFYKAISFLPKSMERPLSFSSVSERAEEIRVRRNLPLALTVSGEIFFCDKSGQTSKNLPENPITVTKEECFETYYNLCNQSVYAHESEIKEGFITTENGIRAGVCGSYNEEGILKEIYSLNIRIPREIIGISNEALKGYSDGGILIAGPPGSGKTTLLRDVVRNLSYRNKITVVDTRGEISGGLINDLGPNTDVIVTPDKSKGIEIAIRTMFPEFLAFDEIGTTDELKGVLKGFKSGVKLITTAHIDNKYKLREREITKRIIDSGEIERIIVLSKEKKMEIIYAEEIKECLN